MVGYRGKNSRKTRRGRSLLESNRKSAGQREIQFAESWPQRPKADYTRMVKEMRDHKLITVAIIFELLQIQNY